MTLVATWWICEPVPIPAASLIGPVLAVLFGGGLALITSRWRSTSSRQ